MLALDFGSARTGIALSDPTGTIAKPVGIVERAATETGLAQLAAFVQAEEVELVVVGLPLTLRGIRGDQAEETERFVTALRATLKVPVDTFDERFTTDLAEQTSNGAGSIDAVAAAHLLSSYLEWSSNQSP